MDINIKHTGIIRRIDDLGRVVIPRELRRKVGIREGDPFELFSDSEGVYFKKYIPGAGLAERVERLTQEIVEDTEIDNTIRLEVVTALRKVTEALAQNTPT